MFKGSMAALITPMHEDGSIDHEALRDLVEWHIANKTDAIIATGTTGENVTLDPEELFQVNELVAKQAAGRIQKKKKKKTPGAGGWFLFYSPHIKKKTKKKNFKKKKKKHPPRGRACL